MINRILLCIVRFLRRLIGGKPKEIYSSPKCTVNEIPELVYFEVDNWFAGRDYPATPIFLKWMGNDLDQKFADSDWCKKNKLCVLSKIVDMSIDYTIVAPGKWVAKRCPEIIGSKFQVFPDESGHVEARFGIFPEYCEENMGSFDDPTYDYWADIEDDYGGYLEDGPDEEYVENIEENKKED